MVVFFIAANTDFLEHGTEELKQVISTVQNECKLFKTGGEATIKYAR